MRVVSNVNKTGEVKSRFLEAFRDPEGYPAQHTYTQKVGAHGRQRVQGRAALLCSEGRVPFPDVALRGDRLQPGPSLRCRQG